MTGEAEKLERAGQLAEARAKYAESQALIEVKDVTDASSAWMNKFTNG